MDAVRWFPIVAPSYANVDGILADVHARKNEEKWEEYNKQLIEKIHLRDHKLGIWIIDILTSNDNVAYTLALRDDEAERVCLL